jgi:hypothetical protein
LRSSSVGCTSPTDPIGAVEVSGELPLRSSSYASNRRPRCRKRSRERSLTPPRTTQNNPTPLADTKGNPLRVALRN